MNKQYHFQPISPKLALCEKHKVGFWQIQTLVLTALIFASLQSSMMSPDQQSGFKDFRIYKASLILSDLSTSVTNSATGMYSTYVLTTTIKRGRLYLVVLYVPSRRDTVFPYSFTSLLCHSLKMSSALSSVSYVAGQNTKCRLQSFSSPPFFDFFFKFS